MTPQHSNKWNTIIVVSGILGFLGTFHLCQAATGACLLLERDGGLWKVQFPKDQGSYSFLIFDCGFFLYTSPDYDGWCLAARNNARIRFKLFQGGEMIYRFQTWDRGLRCFTGSMRLEITGSTFSSRYGIGAELRYGLYKNVTADKDCPSGAFRCRDSKMCIPSSLRCDGSRHCLDGSDDDSLTGCPTTTTLKMATTEGACPRGQRKCNDGRCIPFYDYCAQHISCAYKSSRCPDSYHCYTRCDEKSDCPDGSDEKDCKPESGGMGNGYFAILVIVPATACVALVCRACKGKKRSSERSQADTAAATPLQPVPTTTPFTQLPDNMASSAAMAPSEGPTTNYNDPPPSYNLASHYPAPKDATVPSYENAVYHPSPVYVATNTASPHPGGATGVPSYEGATYHPAPTIGGAQPNPQHAPYSNYHAPPASSPYGSLVPPTGVAPSPLIHGPPPSGLEAPPPPFTGNAPPVMPPPPGGSAAADSIPTLPPPSYNQAVQQDISSTV